MKGTASNGPWSKFVPMPVAPPSYATLSAMITPALFMTANGSLIISTSNRMSRIVDRIRVLNDLGDALGRGALVLDFVAERRAMIADQIRRLERRGDCIRLGLTFLYLAFASFVGTSLTLALDVLLESRLRALPTSLAIVGVSLLLGACINLVREALEALRSNRLEIRFFRDLQARRDAAVMGAVPLVARTAGRELAGHGPARPQPGPLPGGEVAGQVEPSSA
jgi:Protein of unknown function (DUF2721)